MVLTLLTEDNYLKSFDLWSKEVANYLAKQSNIELGPPHWFLINEARRFYQLYELPIQMRPFIQFLKDLDPSINSQFILELFPNEPEKLLTQISGLPKSPYCF